MRFLLFFCLLLLNLNAFSQTPIQVTTQALSEVVFYPTFNQTAQVISLNNSHISSRLSAPIITIQAKVGDRVKQGDELATLDCTDYIILQTQSQQQLNSQQHLLRLARTQLARTRSLQKSRNTSKQRLNQHESNVYQATLLLAQLTAQTTQADLNVQRCHILAPFDGIIQQKTVALGDWVALGQALFLLIDSGAIELEAQLPTPQIKSIKQAEGLVFHYQNTDYPITLKRIVPIIQTPSEQQTARFLFSKQKPLIGSRGELRWRSHQAHLPAKLLVSRQGRMGFFSVKNQRAIFYPLKHAQEGQASPVSVSNIHLVIQGQQQLSHNQTISRQ